MRPADHPEPPTPTRTLDCPKCGKHEFIRLTAAERRDLNDRSIRIQVSLRRLSADDRERFITGFCPACWNKLFGTDGASPSGPRSLETQP